MAHDARGDPAGTTSRMPADSVSNRGGFPTRLDTSSFSAQAGAAAAASSEATSTPSSTSRHGPQLVDPSPSRPQSFHPPSQVAHHHAHAHTHAHARAAMVPGRAHLPRRWTTSSPHADVDILRSAGGTAAPGTAMAIPVRRPSALQRVASSIRRLTHSSPSPASRAEGGDDDDWSVFGEVMAGHEGASAPAPLSPLSLSSRSPSTSRVRRSDEGDGVVPNLQVLLSTPVGGEPGYTSSTRRTQSPMSDAHFEDYFPLEVEEEGQEDEEGAEGNYHEGVSSSDVGLRPSHAHVDSDTELPSSTSSYKGSSMRDRSQSRVTERRWQSLLHLPTLPTLYRNILKCSLAYLLGSLFTYYTPLAHFISELTQDSPGEKYPSVMGHMVATV